MAAKKKSAKGYQNILVPVDFSKPSDKALAQAIHMAQTFGGRLRLLHVIENTSMATESLQWIDFYNEVLSVVTPLMQNLADKVAKTGLTVKTDIVRGVAYEEVVKQAKRHKVDLIVIGTHGRKGIQRWVMGSVAERVVRMAPCPVLSVHP